jgi:predicted transcriptional regulator of viral defense system
MYLTTLVKTGELERVSRGVYVDTNQIEDEMYYLQVKYPKLIYSHETALYFHGLTDQTPFEYSATVPSGYQAMSRISESMNLYYIKKILHQEDVVTMMTSFGNKIKIYSVERTICDIVRSRNRMDSQIVNEALKRLPNRNEIDFSEMMVIANTMKIKKIVRGYLEVLL